VTGRNLPDKRPVAVPKSSSAIGDADQPAGLAIP